MHTVKNFGDGHIIEFPNGDEVFVDENGASSTILKNKEILESAIKNFTRNTDWKAEEKSPGRYVFTHPETKGISLRLNMDFEKRICAVSFNGSEFKTLYIDEENVLGLLHGQMENALAP